MVHTHTHDTYVPLKTMTALAGYLEISAGVLGFHCFL